MPLHRIFVPKGFVNAEQKKKIANEITDIYGANLPRFYVIVVFHILEDEDFYYGGESAQQHNFVRIVTQHLARTDEGEAAQKRQRWIATRIEDIVKGNIPGKQLHTEIHIENHERNAWKTDGLYPPLPNTDAEKLWTEKNAALPYPEDGRFMNKYD